MFVKSKSILRFYSKKNLFYLLSIIIVILLFIWPAYYQLLIPIDFSRPEALKGNELSKGTLSLTFDDGPSRRTLELAHYLHDENIQATFFMIGRKISGNKSQLKEIKKMGHLIGNHTWSHPELNHNLFCLWNGNTQEISKTDREISSFVTLDHFLFRPPFGRWNSCLLEALQNKSLKRYVGPVVWDIDGRDWDCWHHLNSSVASCGEQYLKLAKRKGSGIVLMHDSIDQTTDLVKWLVPRLKKQGYAFIRLDEVPSIKRTLAQKQSTLKSW